MTTVETFRLRDRDLRVETLEPREYDASLRAYLAGFNGRVGWWSSLARAYATVAQDGTWVIRCRGPAARADDRGLVSGCVGTHYIAVR